MANTIVKRVIVGTPIRRVDRAIGLDLGDIQNVDTTAKTDGSFLVYDSDTATWITTITLSDYNLTFDGGTY